MAAARPHSSATAVFLPPHPLNGQAPVTTVLDPEGRATAIGENLGENGPYSSTFDYNQDDLPTTVTLHSDTPAKQSLAAGPVAAASACQDHDALTATTTTRVILP